MQLFDIVVKVKLVKFSVLVLPSNSLTQLLFDFIYYRFVIFFFAICLLAPPRDGDDEEKEEEEEGDGGGFPLWKQMEFHPLEINIESWFAPLCFCSELFVQS